jgi:hypothetical protein
MRAKLKYLGEGITAAYGVVETHIRNHFWYILVILLVTFILSLSKGSDADRLSLASATLSIALAIIVVIFSIVHACDMKEVVKQGWQKTQEDIKSLKTTSEGEISTPIIDLRKKPTTAIAQLDGAAIEYEFDPSRVSWMTLIVFYCLSKAKEKGKKISKMGIASGIDGVLREQLNINYTMVGVHAFFEGVVYGLMCFLPEDYITSTGDTVTVTKLPENFPQTVEQRIAKEEVETPRGKMVFETLRPQIDAYFP